jgi:hypothetical protein
MSMLTSMDIARGRGAWTPDDKVRACEALHIRCDIVVMERG